MPRARVLCLIAVSALGAALAAQTPLVVNGGFENGATGWSGTTSAIGTWSNQPAYEGKACARFLGTGKTATQSLYQAIAIPSAASSATLSFMLHIDTAETSSTRAYDKLLVQVLNSSGTVLKTLATYSNLNKLTGYAQRSFDLAAYRGQSIRLQFKATEDSSLQTTFVVDQVALAAPTGADTTPPTVSASMNGSSGSITLGATATDDRGVTRVEWYVDGALAGTDTSSPWSLAYDSTRLGDGAHSLQAKAYDAVGNVGSSQALSFTVKNAGALPDPQTDRVKADLDYLCSDALAGRKTGQNGATLAAAYIAQKMQETGLSPIKDGGLGGPTVFHAAWTYTGTALAATPETAWSASFSPAAPGLAATTYNVVGVIPGTDATLQGEYIFVTAHYDHMGTTSGGAIYRGADDNASGTVGLLETARLLRASAPRRTIVFLATSGEEQGLLGSAAFLNASPVTLGAIKADVNLDMIGRGRSGELHVMPAKTDGYVTTLTQDARSIAPAYGLTLSAGIEQYWQDSDHYNFGRRGIPCICFNTGIHSDLHMTTDTPDKIDYAKLTTTVKIVRDLVLKVANDPLGPQPVAKSVWSTWTWGGFTSLRALGAPASLLFKEGEGE